MPPASSSSSSARVSRPAAAFHYNPLSHVASMTSQHNVPTQHNGRLRSSRPRLVPAHPYRVPTAPSPSVSSAVSHPLPRPSHSSYHTNLIEQTIYEISRRVREGMLAVDPHMLQRILDISSFASPSAQSVLSESLSLSNMSEPFAASQRAIESLRTYTIGELEYQLLNKNIDGEANNNIFPTIPKQQITSSSSSSLSPSPTPKEGALCSICLCELEIGEVVIEFPCKGKHTYHSPCILEWLKKKNSCPQDRYKIDTNNREYNRKLREIREKEERAAAAKQSRSSRSSPSPPPTHNLYNTPFLSNGSSHPINNPSSSSSSSVVPPFPLVHSSFPPPLRRPIINNRDSPIELDSEEEEGKVTIIDNNNNNNNHSIPFSSSSSSSSRPPLFPPPPPSSPPIYSYYRDSRDERDEEENLYAANNARRREEEEGDNEWGWPMLPLVEAVDESRPMGPIRRRPWEEEEDEGEEQYQPQHNDHDDEEEQEEEEDEEEEEENEYNYGGREERNDRDEDEGEMEYNPSFPSLPLPPPLPIPSPQRSPSFPPASQRYAAIQQAQQRINAYRARMAIAPASVSQIPSFLSPSHQHNNPINSNNPNNINNTFRLNNMNNPINVEEEEIVIINNRDEPIVFDD